MPSNFLVYSYPEETAHPYDIAFRAAEGAASPLPPGEALLKSEIEKTILVLRGLFKPEDERFRVYHHELLSLAQYGLVGTGAQPDEAANALKNFQSRILSSEKGHLVSTHLAKTFGVFFGEIVMLYVMFLFVAAVNQKYQWYAVSLIDNGPLLVIPVSLFIGFMISSFLRYRSLGFFDLHTIDADAFKPYMRGLFALTMLAAVAVFLKAGVFEIVVGKAKLSDFDSSVLSAFTFGLLVGLGQEQLIARIDSVRRQI